MSGKHPKFFEVMLEKLCIALGSGLGKLYKWVGRHYSGWWLAGLVLIFVFGRLAWLAAARPAHRAEIAKTCGSTGVFYGRPQPDPLARRLTYLQRGEQGVTVCWRDLVTGQFQTMAENRDFWMAYMAVWPWSPDGRHFIYSTADKLAVGNGDTGGVISEFPITTTAFMGEARRMSATAVCGLVWLDAHRFAYINREHHLGFGEQSPDGSWRKVCETVVPHQSVLEPGSLSVVETNVVAWAQDGAIWQMKWPRLLPAEKPDPVWKPNSMPAANLLLWLDASSLSLTNGEPVAIFPDLSPQQNNLRADVAAPVFNAAGKPAASNGKATVHFGEGQTSRTVRPLNLAGSAPRSLFAVMRRIGNGNLSINTGGAGQNYALRNDLRYALIPSIEGVVDVWTPARPARQWDVWEIIYDGTNQTSLLNGVMHDTRPLQLNTGAGPVEIGGQSVSGNTSTPESNEDADFAELLIYGSALPPAQRMQVEHYLKAKWLAADLEPAAPPQVWMDATNLPVNQFSFNRSSHQWLLIPAGDSLWLAEAGTNGSFHPKLLFQPGTYFEPAWVTDKTYACLSRREKGDVLLLGGDPDLAAKQLPAAVKNVSHYSPAADGKSLVFTGVVSNQVESIWQYEFDSKNLRCLVPYAESPSPYVRHITMRRGTLTLPSGFKFDYDVYLPPGYSRKDRRKHPVVIGDTVFAGADPMYQARPHGSSWTDALANCGAFVVVAERPSWSVGIEQWEECVAALRQMLAEVPAVDLDQAYVFGASAETHYLSELVVQHPEWWQGVILLNPGQLPDLAKMPLNQPLPKMLISYGGDEHMHDYIQRYQTNAMAYGIRVEAVEHPGNAHWLTTRDAIRLRTQKVIAFVFDD